MSSPSGSAERSPARAALVEIFASVQGEGRFAGEPMAFLRVAVCPLRCTYCDTPESYVATPQLAVREHDGTRREPNPVTAARAAELLLDLRARGPLGPALRAVSVTGGEPLLYPGFVAALGAALAPHGMRVHLETAALDAAALQHCIGAIAHLSADWKLPETVGGARHCAQHAGCVAVAVEAGRTVDVKIVLTADYRDASLQEALAHLAPFRERILLVLQPVTPFGAATEPVAPPRLLQAAAAAAARGFELRVLPQLHPRLGLR